MAKYKRIFSLCNQFPYYMMALGWHTIPAMLLLLSLFILLLLLFQLDGSVSVYKSAFISYL